MSKTISCLGKSLGQAANANLTLWGGLADGSIFTQSASGEVEFKHNVNNAGTYSFLYWRVKTNTTTATSTLTFRKNAANGNQVLTFASGITGETQDTTHTDAVAVNDLVNYQIAAGTTGTSITSSILSIMFDTTSGGNTKRHGIFGNISESGTGVTKFLVLAGAGGATTLTEANTQTKCKLAGTWKYLQAFLTSTNSRAVADSFVSRIGGVTGNMTATTTASTAGLYTDTTHTDTVASGNLLNYGLVLGASASAMSFQVVMSELINTGGIFHFAGGSGSLPTFATSLSPFFAIASDPTTGSTTESDAQLKCPVGFTWSNLQINNPVNAITANTTFTSRIGAIAGNQTITIASGITGISEDTTHTDAVSTGNEIDYQLATGATGTTITVSTISSMATISSGTPAPNSNFFFFFN